MNKDELIKLMTSQHRKLQQDLQDALREAVSAKPNIPLILGSLEIFKQDLNIHLTLENRVFYPDYMKLKSQMGQETQSIQVFIDKMMQIGSQVEKFLTAYGTLDALTADILNFSKSLVTIIKTLNLRIEIEEESLYKLYLIV